MVLDLLIGLSFHVAASWNNLPVIKELVKHAGKYLAWDALTDDKQTANDLALNCEYIGPVQTLLDLHEIPSDMENDNSDNESCLEEFVACVENLEI